MTLLRRLGLDDWKAVSVIVGSVAFLILLLGVLPYYLRERATSDFRGAPVHSVKGIVSLVTISPVSQGGGGLFNAVAVKFAGYQEYYALPPKSLWYPRFGQSVTVAYQIGRRTGNVRVDSVTPIGP